MKQVALLKWPDIDNAWLCLSATQGRRQTLEPLITFVLSKELSDLGRFVIEWNGETNQMPIWQRQSQDGKGVEHWFFDRALNVTTLVLDDATFASMQGFFSQGEWAQIFAYMASIEITKKVLQ